MILAAFSSTKANGRQCHRSCCQIYCNLGTISTAILEQLVSLKSRLREESRKRILVVAHIQQALQDRLALNVLMSQLPFSNATGVYGCFLFLNARFCRTLSYDLFAFLSFLLDLPRKALEQKLASHTRQERVISLLEASNFTERNASRSHLTKGSLEDSSSTAGKWVTPALDIQQLDPAASRPPYQPPLRTYTEWHLKTVYGEHNFAERAKLERTNGDKEHAKQHSDRRRASRRLRPFDSGQHIDGDDKALGNEGHGFDHSRPTSSQAKFDNAIKPSSSWAGNVSLTEVLAAGPSRDAVYSLNPIRVAPGTPLTGPQSMPAHLTTPGAEDFLRYSILRNKELRLQHSSPGSKISRRGRSAENSKRPQFETSPVRKINHSNTLSKDKSATEVDGIISSTSFNDDNFDASALSSEQSSHQGAWFWGRSAEEEANSAPKDTEKSEAPKDSIRNSDACNMFWRGDDRVVTLVAQRENDKIQEEELKLLAAEAIESVEAEIEKGSSSQESAGDAPPFEDLREESEDEDMSRAGSSAAASTVDPQDFIFGQLRKSAMHFIATDELKSDVQNLQKLKNYIAECTKKENDMEKELESIKGELDQHKSTATVGVAEVQIKLSNEHAKLMHLDARLAQLRVVEDEFTERDAESLEEEARLVERQLVIGRRINKAEARLATALAVEMRVAGECELELRDARTVHMAARHDTVRAYRLREDAVYNLHLKVKAAAATVIQRFLRARLESSLSHWNTAVLRTVLERTDTGLERLKATLTIQCVIRRHLAHKKVVDVAKKTYEKLIDHESGDPYYWNTNTNEAQWTKPKLFGESDDAITLHSEQSELSPPSVRQVRAPTSIAGAALRIQGVFRAVLARRRILKIIKSTYEKLHDEESGYYYYWNLNTAEAQWVKPKKFGDNDDIELSSE